MLSKQEITNRYVDEKNALMLTILGLHETLEQFKSRGGVKYWIKDDYFCFDTSTPGYVFRVTLRHIFAPGYVLEILNTWGGGAIDYVE